MSRTVWQLIARALGRKARPSRPNPKQYRFVPSVEGLENREVPAVTASFSAVSGVLTVFGDNLDNNITISSNAAGTILVNGGGVTVAGGKPTVEHTGVIQGYGKVGEDKMTINDEV